ncbi:DUF5788 family protein [Halobacterium litoreum]|uniref:DUF5788 family protein n=1 Tax=Halobacterium litoreum TaxID=2039234 RepID=A0ABD5NCG1_9EURY|nr:DUF5788 family protein [Halobacterium litoreum]UHH14149.1 DUF5788 family protein [Halobacterium litoreum]
MDERERQRLLDRVERPSNSIGESIPDELSVGDTTIDLKAFVFECKRLDAVPTDRREEIESVQSTLRRERLRRKRRIRDDDISRETAEELAASVHGIDRALNALAGLNDPDIGEELRQKRLDDARELLALADTSL